jgi:methionyl-tRNA formyltransferase
MNYCICVSGTLGLTVLQRLVASPITIKCVLTDKHSDGIIEYCEQQQLQVFAGNPRNSKAVGWLEEQKIEFENLLSINYLFILEPDVLNKAKGYAVNFHGSLLPKYRGRTPHVWSIINGEKETGVTAHLMNANCDDGDIVRQVVVPIEEEDTGAIILEKYKALYPELVLQVVEDIESGKVECCKQDISKATYFGKRTPDDGQINWNWQKERIRNWVRAQAKPYPGAFTFLNDNKIIINKIEYSDLGLTDTIQNGTVVAVIDGCPYVKTQNGVVKLVDFETDAEIIKDSLLS